MKNSLRRKRSIEVILSCIVLFTALVACSSNNSEKTNQSTSSTQTETEKIQSKDKETNKNTRAIVSKDLKKLKKQYEQNSEDSATALRYAQALFSLGDLEKAQTIVKPLLTKEALPEATYLAAQIDYLNGHYEKAEERYSALTEQGNADYQSMGKAGLQMVYYQTNAYDKASQLYPEKNLENPLLDMMNAFDETPYQIDWHDKSETIIPFSTTEPIPIVPIEINGIRMNAFIDTGAPMLAIDQSIASKLGIISASSAEGHGAGGSAEISFGKADAMKLGDVAIQNFPVLLMPFDGFEHVFDGHAENVHAIIGTNVLQQFIPIIDYPSGRMVLVQRSEAGHSHIDEIVAKETVLDEIPFILANTHYMFAQGSINGKTGLNMFVDTGMIGLDNTGIELPKETMDLLAIPTPELISIAEGHGGIGGSDYQEGVFDLASYGLGNLKLEDDIGLYSTSGHSDDWIDMDGLIGDALIGYHYLKQYRWIINFDAMTMTFCK